MPLVGMLLLSAVVDSAYCSDDGMSVGAVLECSDSSEYLQHYSSPAVHSSPLPSCGTVPLSFPRDEAMVVLPADRVQRAADPLAPYAGRVPRMTDNNTSTIVAGASRKNTAYDNH